MRKAVLTREELSLALQRKSLSICCPFFAHFSLGSEISHLERRLQYDDITRGLDPRLAVNLNRQLRVHADLDVTALFQKYVLRAEKHTIN